MKFGVNVRSVDSPGVFAAHVRRADELGYDVFAVPDHVGAPDPFVTLATAAQISDRLRLRTYVLNAGFHNPALLARAVASLDALSGGRLELGLGAGNAADEFHEARLPFGSYTARLAAIQATAVEVRARLAAPDHAPRPVQQPVPLMIGAMSPRGLAIAARHADTVAFSGLREQPGGGFRLATSAETDAAVVQVRGQAAGRALGSDALLQMVVVDGDPRAQAAAWAPGADVDAVLDSPFVLFAADPEGGLAELERRRERWGFDSFTTHAHNLEALGKVIALQR